MGVLKKKTDAYKRNVWEKLECTSVKRTLNRLSFTLDLSQKAEKGMPVSPSLFFLKIHYHDWQDFNYLRLIKG